MARQDSNDHWVYRIEVAGTDICEYYDMPYAMDTDEVKEVWLSDVRSKEMLGQRLAAQFADRTEVTKLWETSPESAAAEKRAIQTQGAVRLTEEDVEERLR